MTSATNAFEDLGYFCVDNMPLTLLPTFARLVQARETLRVRLGRRGLTLSAVVLSCVSSETISIMFSSIG